MISVFNVRFWHFSLNASPKLGNVSRYSFSTFQDVSKSAYFTSFETVFMLDLYTSHCLQHPYKGITSSSLKLRFGSSSDEIVWPFLY